MTYQIIEPTEALNRTFELPDGAVEYQSDGKLHASQAHRRHAFTLNTFGLLIPPEIPGEICLELPLCRLPNTPRWLIGIANLRGNTVPVFDLHLLMRFECSAESSDQKFLILGERDKAVGVLVYQMPLRVALQSSDKLDTPPPLPAVLQPFAHSCYRTDRIWVDWDLDGFFLSHAVRT